jgi:hypothetical protein
MGGRLRILKVRDRDIDVKFAKFSRSDYLNNTSPFNLVAIRPLLVAYNGNKEKVQSDPWSAVYKA